MPAPDHRQGLPCDLPLLVGRHHEDLHRADVGGDHCRALVRFDVACLVDLDPERLEPGQTGRPELGAVLADSGSEDHRVDGTEHGEVGPDVLANAIGVDVERKPGSLVALRA